MNRICPCRICNEIGHSSSKCPCLTEDLKQGFYSGGGGGGHSHDEDDESCRNLVANQAILDTMDFTIEKLWSLFVADQFIPSDDVWKVCEPSVKS